MKNFEWLRDKLHALAIEADEMLGSCDASDILDALEEARNAMTEGAEAIARLMAELQYSKDGLNTLLDEARKREAELARVKRERDAAVEAMRKVCADYAGCWGCKRYNPKIAYTPNDCMDCVNACNWEWRGVQEVAKMNKEEST